MPSLPILTTSPTRYAGNPVWDLATAASWWVSQIFDFCALEALGAFGGVEIYCSGMAAPVETGIISIGLFTADRTLPVAPVDRGVVLTAGTGGAWDEPHVRLGSVIDVAGTRYMYYTGISGSTGQIGLATSIDGVTFTKHASNPILTPTGQGRNDGTYVSEPAVICENGAWTMIYSYRNGGTIMPGLRYATSTDGVTWTKAGTGDAILSTAPLYAEFHQIQKIGNRYWLCYEVGNTSTAFTINFAYNDTNCRSLFTNLASNPTLAGSGVPGTWDRYHVATPCLTSLFDNAWVLLYQGAGTHDQPYGTNSWPGGYATYGSQSIAARGV